MSVSICLWIQGAHILLHLPLEEWGVLGRYHQTQARFALHGSHVTAIACQRRDGQQNRIWLLKTHMA